MGPSDAEVYEKYSRELIGFAAAVAGPTDAEDVVAGAVLRAISSPRWRAIDNRRAYLYRAVMSEAHNMPRSTARRLKREERAAAATSFEVSPNDHDVLAALRRLTVRQRAVVFLTYWTDQPAASVADTLGMSQRSVERELTMARRRIEEMLT